MNTLNNQQELTEAEMKEQKAKMLAFYEEHIEFIELEARYEKALATTATSRVQTVMADQKFTEYMMQQNQMANSPKED